MPDPMPDTAKQARKMDPIIKSVPSISEDGLCVNLRGEPRCIPDTELGEFERYAAEIKDLNEVKVQGTEMYDPGLVERLGVLPPMEGVSQFERYERMPENLRSVTDSVAEKLHAAIGVENMGAVPKDMPVNTILYTNWNLGLVTWTTAEGDISITDVSQWRPMAAAQLMRYINRHDITRTDVRARSLPESLEYLCCLLYTSPSPRDS